MKALHLNLKGQYFDAIKAGTKEFEYRLNTPRWRRLIEGKEFDKVIIKRGYPKRGDTERTMVLPWGGFEMQTITHPHFGDEPVEVFAIRVRA